MNDLLAHCSAAFSGHTSLLATFFFGGVAGGFTHCVGMCGPMLASSVTSCAGSCGKACGKTTEALQQASGAAFHLGRMASYGVLGFLASALSSQISSFSFWPVLSATMLVVAGILFIVSSLLTCSHHLPQISGGRFWRGALLGFMPCGLLYAALMMAATITNPFVGMVAMWIFTLGTVPALLLASGGTHLLRIKWQSAGQRLSRALMAFNGISLLFMAARIIR